MSTFFWVYIICHILPGYGAPSSPSLRMCGSAWRSIRGGADLFLLRHFHLIGNVPSEGNGMSVSLRTSGPAEIRDGMAESGVVEPLLVEAELVASPFPQSGKSIGSEKIELTTRSMGERKIGHPLSHMPR